jgi:bacterioferritin
MNANGHQQRAILQDIARNERLYKYSEKRAIEKMRHPGELIGRILFLEGRPTVGVLGKMSIGADVPLQLAGDHSLEISAVKACNAAIEQAGEAGDFATREILEHVLQDEDRHIDDIEELQDQIEQMTLPIFLPTQVSG